MLRVHLCGSLAVEVDGRRLPESQLAGRQGRLVVAYLVCANGRPVPRGELADLLWGDEPPSSWPSSLSVVVSKLRRMFADAGLEDLLVSELGSYRVALPDDAWVDWNAAAEFADIAERALERGEYTVAVENARGATQIAALGFLTEDCPWVDTQRQRLRELHVAALHTQAHAHLLAGERGRAVVAARDALALDDLSEESYRLLMQALAAAGERAEALRVWERCRVMLVDELGVDPAPETEAVYLALLGDTAPAHVRAGPSLPSGVVTFLLTDIVESTALWEANPAAMAVALERHDRLVDEVVSHYGGTMLKAKLEGDATVSVFPRASGAVLGAMALADAIVDEPWPDGTPLRLRMALHTGEAVERDGDYFGPALNRAARLRAMAEAGQILVSQAVAELVRDHLPDGVTLRALGEHHLRGLTRGEHVYELATSALVEQAGALERPPLPVVLRADGPFVGRDAELDRLDAEWHVAASGTPRVVLIAGEPGVGKSRLAAECAQRAYEQGALVLYGRCDEELGAPYQPFAEAVRDLVPSMGPSRLHLVRGVEQLARVVPDVADHIASSIPATPSDPDTERSMLFDAFARLLTTAALEAPILIVVDDLHWAAKPTLLLLRHLLRSGAGTRLLLVGTYRSTDLSRSHPLAAMLTDLHRDGTSERIILGGLGAEDVSAYLRATGHDDSTLSDALATVTSGNPFFLIEVLRHVEETGGRWDPSTLPQGVREAVDRRLTRLSAAANDALLAGAVVGNQFSLDLIEQVLQTDLVEPIDEARRAGLVVEESGSRYRFDHALVRQSVLAECATVKRLRLHQRIAAALEADPTGDHVADLARHYFECAMAGGAAKAVDYSRRAGEQAMGRLAYEEAADLYAQALVAADVDGSAVEPDDRAELLLARCEALLAAGDPTAASGVVDELGSAARHSARLSAWATCFRGQLAVLVHPEDLESTIGEVGAAADVLARLGDAEGEAKAHTVRASCLAHVGRVAECETALDRGLVAARLANSPRHVNAVLAFAPLAALSGPSAVPQASGRCLDVVRVLRITTGSPAVEAAALRCQAVLEAVRGRVDPARRMLDSARRSLEALGHTHGLLETDMFSGMVELAGGRADAAEAALRRAYRGFTTRGVGVDAAQAGALLARALVAQGHVDEAIKLTEESERLAGADLKAAIAWRAARAEALARTGALGEALELAAAAVALADPTDALLDRAEAHFTLAVVQATAGDATAAHREAQIAAELYERKGAAALARAAGHMVGTAPAAPAGPPASHRRRTRPNRAYHQLLRSAQIWREGDQAAYAATLAAEFTDVDHVSHVTSDRATFLQMSAASGSHEGPELSHDLLATLGDRHSLARYTYRYPGSALVERDNRTGELEFDLLIIQSLDGAGLTDHIERFRVDDLDVALARLVELHADDVLPPERRAERYAIATHIREGLPEPGDGVDAARARRLVDVLGFGERALVAELSLDDGESRPVLVQYGADGSVQQMLWYSTDRVEDALAWFDELTTGKDEGDLVNGATQLVDRMVELYAGGDWQRMSELMEDNCVIDDRRAIVTHRAEGRDAVLGSLATAVDLGMQSMATHKLAVRGNRLALTAHTSAAPFSDIPVLTLTEASERGRTCHAVVFDPDALDAAFDELDARYLAGEGAPYAETLAPMFALARALNHGVRPSSASLPDDAAVDGVQPPVRVIRIEEVTSTGSVSVWHIGPAATPARVVCATDRGQIAGLDIATDRVPFRRRVMRNAATACSRLEEALMAAGALDEWESTLAPDAVDVDHVAHVTSDRETLARAARIYGASEGLTTQIEWIASLGERHLVERGTYRFDGAAISDPDKRTGTAEFSYLHVRQVDSQGRCRRLERFRVGDLHLALARLVELHADDETPPVRRAEREAIARSLRLQTMHWSVDAVLVDHRPAGIGTIHGGANIRAAMETRVPDQQCRITDVLAFSERTHVTAFDAEVLNAEGRLTRWPGLAVAAYDAAGLHRRVEWFDTDQVGDALARFDALSRQPQVSVAPPRRVRANSPVLVGDTIRSLMEAGNHDAWAGLIADDYVDVDHIAHVTTGRDAILRMGRTYAATAVRTIIPELLASLGERHQLSRMTTRMEDAAIGNSASHAGDVEIVLLTVGRADAQGRLSRVERFQPDDLSSALARLVELHAEEELPPSRASERRAVADALRGHQPIWSDEAVLVDHRPAGFGTLHGSDVVRAAVTAGSSATRLTDVLGFTEHVTLTSWDSDGLNRDGPIAGLIGPASWEGLVLIVSDVEGRVERCELYRPDQAEQALRRFDELSSTPA